VIVKPRDAECPWLEYAPESKSLRFRSDRAGCEIVKISAQESVVVEMVRALALELTATLGATSLASFGLNQYPELYERIALDALSDPRWNKRAGKPVGAGESVNARVVALGEDRRHFVEVARIFDELGYHARLSSVEKVFVGTPSETSFGEALRQAGAKPGDKIPYESMVGFKLEPSP